MSYVILLGWLKSVADEDNGVDPTIVGYLIEHFPHHVVQHIGLIGCSLSGLKWWRIGAVIWKCPLRLSKGDWHRLVVLPSEYFVALQRVVEGDSNDCVLKDESAIEICESKEACKGKALTH